MSTAYDFSTTGPGTFTIDPVPWFQVVGIDGTAKTHVADTRSVSITVTDGVSKREVDLEKRTIVICKDDAQNTFLVDSLLEAWDLSYSASAHLMLWGDTSPIFKEYFGLHDGTVRRNFDTIYEERLLSVVLVCGGSSDRCSDGIAGYSDDNQTFYFCPLFFAANYPAGQLCKGANVDEKGVRGGIVISQLAYALLGAQEFKGGCSDSRDLPDDEKLINAANYEVILVPFVVYPALAH